jgi:uncharacterized protein YgiM (DUF1202 family)
MKIFISYSHVDQFLVESQIIDILTQAGHDVWFDERLVVGQNWKKQLSNAVATSDALVFAISPESVKSKYCQWEVDQALDLNKPIFPVLVQARTPIPKKLDGIQYVDFTKGATGSAVAKLMQGLQKRVSASPHLPPLPIPEKEGTQSNTMINLLRDPAIQAIIGIVGIIIAIILFLIQSNQTPAPILIETSTPTITVSPTETLTPTETIIPTDEPTATEAPTSTPISTPPTPLVESSEETVIRTGPGAGFETLTTWDGRPLDILGMSDDGGWYQVLLRDGRRGWVITSQNVVDVKGDKSIIPTIVVTNTPTVTPSKTQTPTLKLTPSVTLQPKDMITPVITSSPTATPELTLTNTSEMPAYPCEAEIVFNNNILLNVVRAGPFGRSSNRPAIQQGSAILILEQEQETLSKIWYHIADTDSNELGWILPDYVILSDSCPES